MQFSEIIGQEEVKQKLISTVHENRVSHAQLFLGPGGSGKLALAIAYSQYINCDNRSTIDSCGTCPSCQQFSKLAHPDLHFSYPIIMNAKKKKELSRDYLKEWREYLPEKHYYADLNEWYSRMETEKKQGWIGVKESNEIIRTLSYKSYEGKYKVMIIWMAERLYHEASPKLLKILEEPPEKTLFILIAEKQEKIISTILSRTQIVKVPRLGNKEMQAILAVQFGYPEDKIHKQLGAAAGNVHAAVQLLEESISGDFSSSEFRDWMLMCYKGPSKNLVDFVAKTARISRPAQIQLLSYGLNLARNCLMHAYGREDIIHYNDEGEATFTGNISKLLNESNAMEYAGLFEEAIAHIDRNGNASLVLMDVSLQAGKLLNPANSKSKR